MPFTIISNEKCQNLAHYSIVHNLLCECVGCSLAGQPGQAFHEKREGLASQTSACSGGAASPSREEANVLN